ncbi:MAG: glycosyltransferase [Bacteroidales bacterium]|nr:glycosyltransferase [Bacteroidales bacterium]
METKGPSVLILCKTLLKGGAEKQAIILAKLLSHDRVSVTLVIWGGEKIDADNLNFIEAHGIKYVCLRRNIFNRFLCLIRLIKEQKINLVLSYLTLANTVAGLTKLFARDLVTVGGIRSEQLPYYKLIVERLFHNRINDATVFNSCVAKTSFEKRGFAAEKSVVIHNAISIRPLERDYRTGDEITIVSVSRFVKSKDFSTALQSFKRLLQNNRDRKLTYCIIGYGYQESEIRHMVRHLDLEKNVKVMIRPANVFDILLNADIYLSTSIFEGLSNSVMEAMAAGLPVVATDVGDNKYLVRDSYNGFLAPRKDVESITSGIQELIDSADKRREFGKNSYFKIKDEFSEEKMLAGYYKLFSEMTLSNSGVSKHE